MIDLHRLAGFRLVANTGGYARAARAADYPITQPALHQQVRKLERELGIVLLERVAKDRMRPTPAGRALLAFVEPFFRDLPAVVRRVRSGEFDGPLAIQAESLLIRQLLPAWLAALRRRRPGVELAVTEIPAPDVEALRSGRADVIVGHMPETHADISSQVVAVLRPALVVPRDRTAPRGRMPRLRDLTDLPFLGYPPGSRPHSLQLLGLAAHDTAPSHAIALDTADAILGFVESGLGWSLVPSLDPSGPTGRRLQSYPLERPRIEFPVVMAWRKDAPENPMLDALIACAPRPTTG